MLRPVEELVDCDSDDENVFRLSLIDRYAARPESLESMCLAEFASEYVSCRECSKNTTGKVIELKNASHRTIGYMAQRKHPAVIRYPGFKRKEENYYRSKLMLFVPWRNEVDDMYGDFNTYKEHFIKSISLQVICDNESRYAKNGKKLDQAIEDMQRAYENGAVENTWDEVAPCAVAEDRECELEGPEDVNVFDEQLPLFEEQMHNRPSNADSRAELRARFTTEANDRVLSDEEYEKQIECLNDEQKTAVMFNRQWCEELVNAVNNSLPRPAAYLSVDQAVLARAM